MKFSFHERKKSLVFRGGGQEVIGSYTIKGRMISEKNRGGVNKEKNQFGLGGEKTEQVSHRGEGRKSSPFEAIGTVKKTTGSGGRGGSSATRPRETAS